MISRGPRSYLAKGPKGTGKIVFRPELPKPGEGDPWYAYEKFQIAVYTLATRREELRTRLRHAAIEFIMVSPLDFPEQLRPVYERLRHDMSRLEPRAKWEGRLDATIGRVRLATCEDFAKRICELADQLRDHLL